MKNKMTKYIVIIGIAFVAAGSYLCLFKAGLPYQDPTTEMVKEWVFYNNLGSWVMASGAFLITAGIGLKLFFRRKNKQLSILPDRKL